MATRPPIRLPAQWSKHVKAGVLHAISVAGVVLTYARTRVAGPHRLRVQLEQANTEIALLREELNIKDGRWERSRSRRRPHYTPTQRMRILQLRAARGWTLERTARVFLLDLHTLQLWMRRLRSGRRRFTAIGWVLVDIITHSPTPRLKTPAQGDVGSRQSGGF